VIDTDEAIKSNRAMNSPAPLTSANEKNAAASQLPRSVPPA